MHADTLVLKLVLTPLLIAAASLAGRRWALAVGLVLLPRRRATTSPPPPPAWDLPARMVITTVLVLLITGAATTLGPRLSGVLATFPVYAAILTVFAHRGSTAAAVQVLRGLLLGRFAFAVFFVVFGMALVAVGLAAGFALATVAALAI